MDVLTPHPALVCLLNAFTLFSIPGVVLLPTSQLGLFGLWFKEPTVFDLLREPKDLCLTMLPPLPILGNAGCLN